MRIQTEEWLLFTPGSRMYKGKMTLFYNGETLAPLAEYLIYDREERKSWEVIVVLPGVEVIPDHTFKFCMNVKIVIMANTVIRIESWAFDHCINLQLVKLSRNLEYIGVCAFKCCNSLTSIFIPPSCTEICGYAFSWCTKLIVLSVPQHTMLGENVFVDTALIRALSLALRLIRASPLFVRNVIGDYENEETHEWIKNLNQNEEYALHRACASCNPSEDAVNEILMQQGLASFQKKNQIGITPYFYLQENPFVDFDVDEKKLINRFVLGMMGVTRYI